LSDRIFPDIVFAGGASPANGSNRRCAVSEFVAAVTAGRSKLASTPIGRDEDAALKSRLTGVPLDANILTVDYYR
jgi:hypothetical protein